MNHVISPVLKPDSSTLAKIVTCSGAIAYRRDCAVNAVAANLGMAQTARLVHSPNCTSSCGLERPTDTVSKHQRLRLVIFQEAPGRWLVRGLEHDVAAEARSIGEAVRALVRLVQVHTAFDIRHGHVPLSAFRPAPQTCWNAFSTGTAVSLAQLGIIPPADWEICVAVAHYRPSEGHLPSFVHARA